MRIKTKGRDKSYHNVIMIMILIILAALLIFFIVKGPDEKITGAAVYECDEEVKSPASQKTFDGVKDKVNSYNGIIEKYATVWGVESALIKAVITLESSGDPNAHNGGAYGLMQILPYYHYYRDATCIKHCGFVSINDFYNPEKNICCGARILKEKYRSTPKVYQCNKIPYVGWEAALRGYNGWGCGDDLDYVETVMEYYEAYANCKGDIVRTSGTDQAFSSSYNYGISYDLSPDFYHKIKYDADDYKTIVNNMKLLVETCSDESKDANRCVTDELFTFNDDRLVYNEGGCDWGASKIFFDFFELYDSCKNSVDTDCICEYYFNTNKKVNIENYLTQKFEYAIKNNQFYVVNPDNLNLNMEFSDDIYLVTDFDDDPDLEKLDEIGLIVNYDSDGEFEKTELDTEGVDPKGIIEKILDMLKTDPDLDNIKLYKDKDGKIGFVVKKHSDTSAYQAKKKCSLGKKFYRICVKSKEEVLAFDRQIKQTKYFPVYYKFALHIKDNPPLPITELKASDEEIAEMSVVLIFKKSDAIDLNRYVVYYGDLSSLKVDEFTSNIEILSDDLTKIIPLSSNDYSSEYDGSIGSLTILKTLEDNSVYNIDDYIIKVVPGVDDENIAYTVVAYDDNGNYIKELPDEAITTAKSIDDLAPKKITVTLTKTGPNDIDLSWGDVTENVDGSPIRTDELVTIWILRSDTPFTKKEEASNLQDVSITAPKPIAVHGLGTGTYYFSVIPHDAKGNYDWTFDVKSITTE